MHDDDPRERIELMLKHLNPIERREAYEVMARALRSWSKSRPDGTLTMASSVSGSKGKV